MCCIGLRHRTRPEPAWLRTCVPRRGDQHRPSDRQAVWSPPLLDKIGLAPGSPCFLRWDREGAAYDNVECFTHVTSSYEGVVDIRPSLPGALIGLSHLRLVSVSEGYSTLRR